MKYFHKSYRAVRTTMKYMSIKSYSDYRHRTVRRKPKLAKSEMQTCYTDSDRERRRQRHCTHTNCAGTRNPGALARTSLLCSALVSGFGTRGLRSFVDGKGGSAGTARPASPQHTSPAPPSQRIPESRLRHTLAVAVTVTHSTWRAYPVPHNTTIRATHQPSQTQST